MRALHQGSQQPRPRTAKSPIVTERARQVLVGIFGAFLGLTLVKFGNPVVLDHLVQAPGNVWELVFSTWPSRWVFDAFLYVGLLFVASAAWAFRAAFAQTFRHLTNDKPARLASLCLVGWYCWQWIASIDTVSKPLTNATLLQFTSCLFCFTFGLFCLSRARSLDPLGWGLLAGFAIVLWSGLDQRFGGLEATQRMIYEQGGIDHYPDEFLKRISTGRVFGTLFYPNAFAGAILLIGPIMLAFVLRMTARRGNVVRGLAAGLLGYLSVAGLYWSGSKSGWLIAAALALVMVLGLPLPKRSKWVVLAIVAATALGAFGVRFAGYFQKGATSVVARFDYWKAAARVTIENPLTGSGPGTFQVPYALLKAPESEMARLVHNDYLQQGSDSGVPGFLLYSGLLLGSVGWLYRKSKPDAIRFSAWLGLAAWALHSFVEFGLYIPALAWPAFSLLGWLQGIDIDTKVERN